MKKTSLFLLLFLVIAYFNAASTNTGILLKIELQQYENHIHLPNALRIPKEGNIGQKNSVLDVVNPNVVKYNIYAVSRRGLIVHNTNKPWVLKSDLLMGVYIIQINVEYKDGKKEVVKSYVMLYK